MGTRIHRPRGGKRESRGERDPAPLSVLARGGTGLGGGSGSHSEPRPAPGEKEGGGTERRRQVSRNRFVPTPWVNPPRRGWVAPPSPAMPITAAVAAESSLPAEPGSPLAPSVAIFPLYRLRRGARCGAEWRSRRQELNPLPAGSDPAGSGGD